MAKIKTIHVTPAPESLLVFLTDRLNILKSNNFEVCGYCYHDDYLDKFKACGFEVIHSNYLSRSFNLLKDFKFFIESYKLFKREKPIIVNTYGLKPGLYARIAARLSGVPIVVHTFWGFVYAEDSPWYKKLPFIFMEKFAALFCDYIFSVNKDDLEVMQRFHYKNSKGLGWLGNGTDIYVKFYHKSFNTEKIKTEKIKMGLKADALIIGQYGRLTESKGYKEFFEAAKKLKRRYANIEFIVAGPFDNTKGASISEKEIKDLENADIIRYLGEKKHEEMPLLYAMTDIVVLMSHREGFPRCLVEAASMGKPLVATDIRGCREAVEQGFNGILVPLKDHQALKNALDKLINNEELRKFMGKNSRIKAEAEYDEEKLVEKILTIYQRLIAEKIKNQAPWIGNEPKLLETGLKVNS